MNSIAAGFVAVVAFTATVYLVAVAELATKDSIDWGSLDLTPAIGWHNGGLGLAVATVVFWFTLGWGRKAAANARRKEIAARARA